MGKCGFLIFGSTQNSHKEPSFQISIDGYGANDPTVLLLKKIEPSEFSEFEDDKDKPKPYHTIIPYGKTESVRGRFVVSFYSQEALEMKELVDWKFKTTATGEWSPSTAGGCKQFEDTWRNNPTFKLQLPSGRDEFTMCVMLSQAKAGMDMVPFQVTPYQFFIGVYIQDKMDIVFETRKWKNALDVWDVVKLNTTKENVFMITPTTFKQGQLTSFSISVFADEDVKFVM